MRLILVVWGLAAVLSPALALDLTANGGFESVSSDGESVAWTVETPYVVTNGVGRNGSRGLLFSAETPPKYVIPRQFMPAQPGARYHASVWVRTENLRGGWANVCVEWYDADGRWISGAYAQGVSGTHDWRQVHVMTPRIPAGAVRLQVSAYVEKGGFGKACFDDVKLEPVAATPVVGLYSDAYRNRAADGEVTFFADLNLLVAGKRPDEVRGEFVLTGKTGERRIAADALGADFARVTVRVEDLTSGPVSFALRDVATDQAIGSGSLIFTRLDAWPAKGVRIDRHRRLIVNGKPFFPLGMYWMEVTAEDLSNYTNGPFNCLMPYGRLDRAKLDLCAEHGLKTMCNVKDFYAFHMKGREGIVTSEDASRAVEKIVRAYKDHPALLGWYPNDEIGLVHRDELVGRQRQLERLDPDHPTWTMLYQVAEMRDYLPTFDICGSDPYPFEARNFEHPYFWPKLQRELTFGARPVWQAVKVHDHAAYFRPDETDRIRAEPVPTIEEIRDMAWQALCAGANGIFFYSFFDLKKMDSKTPFARRFADVCQVARELKSFEKMFLSTETPVSAEVTTENERDFACRTWRTDGRSYVAVVNLTWRRVSGPVRLGESFTAAVPKLGGGQAVQEGSRLFVELPPKGVSVLELIQ